MGTLVLDIETASPFEEPPENSNDTKYYEWFAVSLAYADEFESTPETEVLFRSGGWDETFTTDLYQRMFDWCDNGTLTDYSPITVLGSTGNISSTGPAK